MILFAHKDVGMKNQRLHDEDEIQTKLDELSLWSALYESIQVVDAATWKKREEVGEQYLVVTDWLYAHDVFPQYDHEHKRYTGKRYPTREREQDEGVKREQNARARRVARVCIALLSLASLTCLILIKRYHIEELY